MCVGAYLELVSVRKRIICNYLNGEFTAVNLGFNLARSNGADGNALFGFHHRAHGEFRESLIEIGGTAAKVRLKSKEVGLLRVCVERLFSVGETGTLNLICKLIVLMSPHIGSYGCRESVESRFFKSFRPVAVTRQGNEPFV